MSRNWSIQPLRFLISFRVRRTQRKGFGKALESRKAREEAFSAFGRTVPANPGSVWMEDQEALEESSRNDRVYVCACTGPGATPALCVLEGSL